jgi:DNA (cytosine-5)-methyltransferase 1
MKSSTTTLRVLDLFCGAGGASMGYRQAWYTVVGVDIVKQPRYPFHFVRGDALEYLERYGDRFDLIHASPPCQAWSSLRSLYPDREYPEMVEATRGLLQKVGVPWVIENVPGAPLIQPVMLCGTMFGLKLYRHRLFETGHRLPLISHPRHTEKTPRRGWHAEWEGVVTVTGGQNVPAELVREAMGIDWMSRDEMSQAIPPAYTKWIGLNSKRPVLAYQQGRVV